MEPVKFALIGTGCIAQTHADAMKTCELARLTAVYDGVPERAVDFASRYGVAAATTLPELLARSDVDAVVLCTPSGARAEPAVAAAQAGKHVLCEKPMEVTLERADRVIQACEKNGVKLGCVFQSRTARNVERIGKAIQSGRFGRMVLANAQIRWFRSQAYYDSGQWRGTWRLDGGGALMNQSIHAVDLLLLFAGKPRRVFSFADALTHRDIEVEDTVVAAILFESGAMGTIEASTSCEPGFPKRLELSGEKGSVTLEEDAITRWVFVDELPEDETIRREGAAGDSIQGGSGSPTVSSTEGHRRQLEDFARAILENRDPMITGREGRRSIELIRAIYESAQAGRPWDFQKGGLD
ncbi:Gfo/Idh/MocA family oxidoreductase [bacterium]|nr:Gfo/Idh/MocA family oxidoreductase [bacterium]